MKIFFYRYGNICEPDVLAVFQKLNMEILEDTFEVEHKYVEAKKKVRHFAEKITACLQEGKVDFVFSMNFFPYVSELCEKISILYVCWSADCPVLELYSASLRNSCNRIFLFDKVQYEELYSLCSENLFYLPLAANVERWDKEISKITEGDREKYAADVSFVGSLYREKSPLSGDGILKLPEYLQGYVQGIAEAQCLVYGENFLQEAETPDLIKELKRAFPEFYSLKNSLADTDAYVTAHYYLGMLVSQMERERLLNKLAESVKVTLYTRSDPTAMSRNIICKGGVSTHTQMPRIFHLSKINLNITMKGIQSGLSLRIYDIMGCGGFLLSNYQQEIPCYFTIGKDLECYESMEDCVEKVKYYLSHEEERKKIADNGYRKVKALHTYESRVLRMLKLLYDGLASGTD